MIITSVTTSEIAKALCNIEVFTQCSFSTIVLVQYAEKSLPLWCHNMFAFGFLTAVLGSGAGYPSSLRPTSGLIHPSALHDDSGNY